MSGFSQKKLRCGTLSCWDGEAGKAGAQNTYSRPGFTKQQALRSPLTPQNVLYSRNKNKFNYHQIKSGKTGTPLVVQWLRLSTSTAWDTGLIPGRGTKIPCALQLGQKKGGAGGCGMKD